MRTAKTLPTLISRFAGRICHFVGFVIRRLIFHLLFAPGHVGPPIPCNVIKLIDAPEEGYYAKDGTGEVSSNERHDISTQISTDKRFRYL